MPAGEVYAAVESPRGELGCYLVSDGTNKPYRLHVRAPSFVNLQSLPALLAAVSSPTPSPSSPRSTPCWGRSTADGADGLSADSLAKAEAIVACYPQRRSALIPLCHLAQAQEGYLTEEAMEDIGELVGSRRPRCGEQRASTTCCTPSRSGATCSPSARTSPACWPEPTSCSSTPSSASASGSGQTTHDGLFTLEEAECLAGCDNALCVQVNHRFFGPIDEAAFDRLVDDLARRPARRRPFRPTAC